MPAPGPSSSACTRRATRSSSRPATCRGRARRRRWCARRSTGSAGSTSSSTMRGRREPRRRIAFADLDAMTEKFWQTILATNLLGPFRCSHAAAPALKRSHGAIVNTASVAGLGRVGSSIAYGASKAGLVSLTRSLPVALAPPVRVNAVAPGFVDSPWTKAWPDERKQGYVGASLMKRACTPADIAEAILFLAAAGAMITGHTLPVDGGLI